MFQENDTYYGPYSIRTDARMPYGIPDWRSEWRDVILPAQPTQQITQTMSYVIRGLEPRAQYEAKVQARNRYGWSPVSDPFTFETTDTGQDSVTHIFNSFYLILIALYYLINGKFILNFSFICFDYPEHFFYINPYFNIY